MFVIKSDFNGDIRRFTLDEASYDDFEHVERTIQGLYRLPDKTLSISYVDDEGDVVLIQSADELKQAIHQKERQDQKLLRVQVNSMY